MSTLAIRCGRCNNRHATVDEVRLCHFPPPPSVSPVVLVTLPTQPQLDYIKRLGGDVKKATQLSRREASQYIDQLKKGVGRVSNPQTDAPNRQVTKVPISMLRDVPDGYYASRPDSDHAYTFFRVSRPKPSARTQFAGALKIQTQHGERYELALVVWPNENVTVYNKSVEDDLLLVVVDKNGCAIAYAEKIGRCMRCNTELTDERSRWFGIGPDCEKVWPHIIDIVTDRKGPFVYGNSL